MIFDPKKGGVVFSTLLTPPPHRLATSLKKSKQVGFKWGGGLGGSGPKSHWAVHLLDKIMILQGVKQTIQTLEVGYVNRPKGGGYIMRACLALI